MAAKVIRLLLIEDNPADAKLIEIMLREVATSQRYELVPVTTFKQGMENLQHGDFDLLLLDLSLPDSFGIDTIQNANRLAPQVPIIVLTGHNDEDFAVEVVNAGAQDYLVKGMIDSSLLSRAIRYAMKRKELEVNLKTVTRQIEESESRLNTIVTYNISGIVVLDDENKIKYANPAAEQMLSKGSAQLCGEVFTIPYSLEQPTLVNLDENNLQVEVLAVKTVWGDEDSTLLTLHDISAIKKAEESLRIKNEELTRINKSLDRFVYMISHDLKKPVANIIGLLTLLSQDMKVNGTDRNKTITEKLTYSASQLKTMIEDLLEATKKEISTAFNFELINFKKLYEEVESSVGQLIATSGATIKTTFSDYPYIYYSYQDLKSILANLLTNAIKYHQPGRLPVVEIVLERTAKGPSLKVTDNGRGIDLANSNGKLFQKYQRLENTGEVEGTGLGLWIIKEIVEKNGGKIEVESEVEKGTTFQIIF